MEVTELIARLVAIQNYSKDIHYHSAKTAAYAHHLLSDLVQDDIDGFIDDIKENVIMGQRSLPKSSKVYLQEAIKFIPDIKDGDDRENFVNLLGLVDSVRGPLKDMATPTRGTASLYDSIGEHLDKMAGLLYMQTRLSDGLNENVEHDHTAATETPIDRKEFEEVIPTPSIAQEIGLKQSAEVAALGENAIDKLADKIKELGL